MDPLRFEAGEVEAFHPLVKLRKHTSDQHLRPAFPTYHERGAGLGSFAGDFSVRWGLNPNPEAARLRNPFRLASRAAQEERISFERVEICFETLDE